MLVYLTHKMALPILKIIRKPESFPYTLNSLQQMPIGTLGNDMFQFLQTKKLTLLPYYAKHDLKHILLDYDTTDEGEVCLQCFMLGNKHISFPVAATVLFGLCTMPEHWKKFKQAYKRGRNAKPIKSWQWNTIVDKPTLFLKNLIEPQ
jgi:ubiquinone biosynthesis protein Coq4